LSDTLAPRISSLRGTTRLLALLLALFGLAASASASELKLSQARIGYRGAEAGKAVMLHGGVEGQSAWLPCELVLDNVGGGTFNGTLSIQEFSDRAEPPLRRPLSLGPNAKKRLRFSLLFRPTSRYRVRFEDEARGVVELADVYGRGEGSRPGLTMPQIRTIQEPLVLVVRGADSLSTQLSDLQGQFVAQDSTAREWLTIELEGVGAIPHEATALHRVSILILDDLDLPSLSQAQQRAVLAWVARGGRLWVSTLKADVTGALGAALPGRSTGEVVAERGLRGLEVSLGGEVPLLGSARELRLFEARSADTNWRGSGRSELLHRRHGRGWIVRGGFSLSRARFDKQTLLRELLVLHQEARTAAPISRKLLGELSAPLNSSTLKRMPPRSTVIGVVILYALLGVAIPFAAFRRNGRLELAWACVLLSTLLATGIVFALGKQTEQASRIVRVSVVEGGAGGANLQATALAVFSKDGGPIPLAFASPVEGALQLTSTRQESSRRKNLSASAGPERFVLETDPQDTTLLGTQELVELPGWVRLTQTGATSALVERSEGWEIKGAWAFDSDGVEFKVLEIPAELRTGPRHMDPVLGRAFQGLRHLAQIRAKERGQPLLVFWWEGAPRQEGLPEFGLDVGLVWASPGWGAWGKRPKEPVKFGVGVENAKGVMWPFYAPLPDATREGAVSVLFARRRFELFNWEREAWVVPAGYEHSNRRVRRYHYGDYHREERVMVPGALRATPLGVVQGQLFVPEGDDLYDPSDAVRLEVSSTRQARRGAQERKR
jgi:hypothetical protein